MVSFFHCQEGELKVDTSDRRQRERVNAKLSEHDKCT